MDHHHHVTLSVRISLTLSCCLYLSSIASGRSSGLHPVSALSCCMLVRAGCPALACPCEGVHRSTSLMSLSLLLQQCPTCLVHLTLIIFVMGGRWPYSCCFVGCCLQDLFIIAYWTSPGGSKQYWYSLIYISFYTYENSEINCFQFFF